ncbi:MAG: hypothetical protein WDW38_007416 [Sanguina aurantia]
MADAAGRIQAISSSSIHRICSGQVILDLATAVKELVENALDAGATNVEVRLKEYGSVLIEVADNGGGIDPSDYAALTRKYHTSKLSEFNDLSALSTFGFRGEALSSLCGVSDVSVVTRTAAQDAGVRLVYDCRGAIVSSSTCPRAMGTTVAVGELFRPLPVRHREFLKNVKREFSKLVAVLQAYALIATRVRLIATNQVGKGGGRVTVVSTSGCSAGREPGVRDNLVQVFGSKAADTMVALNVASPEIGLTISGYVSKANAGVRGDASRQFFFLNGRPVDLPKAAKLLNDTYRSLSSAMNNTVKPAAVLDFGLARDGVDVNVTPDKRQVFIAGEAEALAEFEKALLQLWEPSRFTYSTNSLAARPKGRAPATATGKEKATTSKAVAAAAAASIKSEPQSQAGPAHDDDDDHTALSEGEQEAAAAVADETDQHPQASEHSRHGIAASTPHPDPNPNPNPSTPQPAHPHSSLPQLNPAPPASHAHAHRDCGPAGGRSTGQQSQDAGHASDDEETDEGQDGGGTGAQQARKRKGQGCDGGSSGAGAGAGRSEKRRRHGGGGQRSGSRFVDDQAAGEDGDSDDESEGDDGDGPGMQGMDVGDEEAGGSRSHAQMDSDRIRGEAAADRHAAVAIRAAARARRSESAVSEEAGGSADDEGGCDKRHGDGQVSSEDEEPGSVSARGAMGLQLREAKRGLVFERQGSWEMEAEEVVDQEQQLLQHQRQQQRQQGSHTEASRGRHSEQTPLTLGSSAQARDRASGQQAAARGGSAAVAPAASKPSGFANFLRTSSGLGASAAAAPAPASQGGSRSQRGGHAGTASHGRAGVQMTLTSFAVPLPRGEACDSDVSDHLQFSQPLGVVQPLSGADHVFGEEDVEMRHVSTNRGRLSCLDTPSAAEEEEEEGLGPDNGASDDIVERGEEDSTGAVGVEAALEDGETGDDSLTAAAAICIIKSPNLQANKALKTLRQRLAADAASDSASRAAAEAAAARELERVIRKDDFKRMAVLGQFNLGFVLARLGGDVFIVDQHAADEKFNFERLQRTLRLGRQPLLQPRRLEELCAMDEMVVRDHLDVFRACGFDFVEGRELEAGAGSRLLLSCVPFSRNVTFGGGDVAEMVGMLKAGDRGGDVRPSRWVQGFRGFRGFRGSGW